MPDALRRFNRVVTNRLLGVLAGRVRPFARLVHTGRRTGRRYRTTLWAFEEDRRVAIALTYGRGVDWAKNLLAAGGGRIELGGETSDLVNPRIVGDDEGLRFMPAPVRAALALLDVHEFVLADRR